LFACLKVMLSVVVGFIALKLGEITAKLLEFSTALPLKIEVIDSEDMINTILPEVMSMLKKGLVEVNDTNIIRYGEPKKAK
jgi:PII-like signaling protein